MPWLEPLAALLGVVSVALMVRQRPLAWPLGLVMVLLYAIVFAQARLYSDMLLQLVYAVLQLYGWRQWHRGDAPALAVSRLPWPRLGRDLAAGLLLTLALGLAMSRYTHAQQPWLDAALTGFSLVAQFWMAHKRLACWPLWLLLDAVYVGLFAALQMPLTALLYLVFMGLALQGWRSWRASLNAPGAAP